MKNKLTICFASIHFSLRYHVFNEIDADPAVVAQEEEEFEDKSQGLLNRFQGLVNKYHQLLIKESLRTCSSSEEVMLARVWDSDEKQLLDQVRTLTEVYNFSNIFKF